MLSLIDPDVRKEESIGTRNFPAMLSPIAEQTFTNWTTFAICSSFEFCTNLKFCHLVELCH